MTVLHRVFTNIGLANAAVVKINLDRGYPKAHNGGAGPRSTSTYAIPEEVVGGGFAIVIRNDADLVADVTTGARQLLDRSVAIVNEVAQLATLPSAAVIPAAAPVESGIVERPGAAKARDVG
jgi:hypothetical protein